MGAQLTDVSVISPFVQNAFQLQMGGMLARVACASRGLCGEIESGARLAVLSVFPDATLRTGERWATQACLISALLQTGLAETEAILRPLRHALYRTSSDATESEMWAVCDEEVAIAEQLVAVLSNRCGLVAELLGRRGPVAMIPLELRLLRRLCLECGAFQRVMDLAQLVVEKARGTAWQLDAAMDIVSVVDACGSWRELGARELEGLASAILSVPSESPRALRLHGKTLVASAQAWPRLSLMRSWEDRTQLIQWGDQTTLLRRGLSAHRRSIFIAKQAVLDARPGAAARGKSGWILPWRPCLSQPEHAGQLTEQMRLVTAMGLEPPSCGRCSQDGEYCEDAVASRLGTFLDEVVPKDLELSGEMRGLLLELAESLAAFADFWFTVAYLAIQDLVDDDQDDDTYVVASIMGVSAEVAANTALNFFEDAIEVFSRARLERSLEYAMTVKNYGKCVMCFFDESDALAVDRPLVESFKLHVDFLGPAHPLTTSVRDLLIRHGMDFVADP